MIALLSEEHAREMELVNERKEAEQRIIALTKALVKAKQFFIDRLWLFLLLMGLNSNAILFSQTVFLQEFIAVVHVTCRFP